MSLFKFWNAWQQGISTPNRRRKSSPISGGFDQCENRLLLSATTANIPAVVGTISAGMAEGVDRQIPSQKMHVTPADYSGKWTALGSTLILTQSGKRVVGNVTFTLPVGDVVSPNPPVLHGRISGLELHATSHFKLTSMGVTHRETGIIDVHQTDPAHFTGNVTLTTNGHTTTFVINGVKA